MSLDHLTYISPLFNEIPIEKKNKITPSVFVNRGPTVLQKISC